METIDRLFDWVQDQKYIEKLDKSNIIRSKMIVNLYEVIKIMCEIIPEADEERMGKINDFLSENDNYANEINKIWNVK